MDFKDLLSRFEYKEIIGATPNEIAKITDRSFEVEEGSLFFCVKGSDSDGAQFVDEVVRRGASVVITESVLSASVCQIIVNCIRTAMGEIAKAFYGNPQKQMKVVGLVGTNGKTSTCHIIAEILKYAGKKTCVTGTLGTYYEGEKRNSPLTTLGCLQLYSLMKEMVDKGVEYFIMEVSAHAIYQKRVEGLYFDALLFTNCTEDHLDYFGSIDEYENVKASIFTPKNCKYMILNSDDKIGRRIIAKNQNTISYGIYNPADVFAININENPNGIDFVINLFDTIYQIKNKLIGLCNVYNVLCASACTAILGVKTSVIARALQKITPIEGRAEEIERVNGARVFIDYAHTPDGLKRTLLSMRKICLRKLVCLFGCGGNREREKRPVMGAISGAVSDFTILTSDNPRYEEPDTIIEEIESGIKGVTKKYITITDRKSAIHYALSMISDGDVLLIAGKGAETYQEVMGEKIEFSDKEIVKDYLSKGKGGKF